MNYSCFLNSSTSDIVLVQSSGGTVCVLLCVLHICLVKEVNLQVIRERGDGRLSTGTGKLYKHFPKVKNL